VAQADYEGIVTSLNVPNYDIPDGAARFLFGMSNPTHVPPDGQKQPVLYVSLERPYGKEIMQLVVMAYQLGVPVQVGLIKNLNMQVDWVQLPKGPGSA
jgi:hypothetical protein